MRNLRRNRRGNSLVESGLMLVMFIFVLTGIADFGQFLYVHQTISERARVAARYGSLATHFVDPDDGQTKLTAADITKIKNLAVYNSPNPPEGATPLVGRLTTGMVTPTLNGTFGQDDARVTVTIANYPFGFISPYMSTSTWYKTITASAPYEVP
jgi:Flp pilus assembly protein TadG